MFIANWFGYDAASLTSSLTQKQEETTGAFTSGNNGWCSLTEVYFRSEKSAIAVRYACI